MNDSANMVLLTTGHKYDKYDAHVIGLKHYAFSVLCSIQSKIFFTS